MLRPFFWPMFSKVLLLQTKTTYRNKPANPMSAATMPSLSLIYTTIASHEDAVTIATELLQQKHIACANIIPAITSLFRWEENDKHGIQHTAEVILLCKTTSEHTTKTIEAIAALHPYDCPAILELPTGATHAPFLQWVVSQTINAF